MTKRMLKLVLCGFVILSVIGCSSVDDTSKLESITGSDDSEASLKSSGYETVTFSAYAKVTVAGYEGVTVTSYEAVDVGSYEAVTVEGRTDIGDASSSSSGLGGCKAIFDFMKMAVNDDDMDDDMEVEVGDNYVSIIFDEGDNSSFKLTYSFSGSDLIIAVEQEGPGYKVEIEIVLTGFCSALAGASLDAIGEAFEDAFDQIEEQGMEMKQAADSKSVMKAAVMKYLQ